jgi:hypothetical protein
MPSVPGYSDIQLMVDQLSFEVQVFQNWSYSLEFPTSSECGWTAVPLHNETLNIDVIHFEKEGTVAPNPRQSSRFFVRSDEFLGNTTAFPEVKWPDPYLIKANNTVTLANYVKLCPDGGWVDPATAFHVTYARAKVNRYGNRVQISTLFLSIVIISNIVKIVGIYFAIRMRSSGHLITAGDAIASFLERPEPGSTGKCTLTKPQLCSQTYHGATEPWGIIKKPMIIVLGGARAWSTTIVYVFRPCCLPGMRYTNQYLIISKQCRFVITQHRGSSSSYDCVTRCRKIRNCFNAYSPLHISNIRCPRCPCSCIPRQPPPSRSFLTILLHQPHMHVNLFQRRVEPIHTLPKRTASHPSNRKATRHALSATSPALGRTAHRDVRTAALAPIAIVVSRAPGEAHTR